MSDYDTIGDRGVTPVIGIVLLLAITVLLAGTIGAFVYGFSDDETQREQPAAAFEFDESVSSSGPDSLTVEHVSGSPIDADTLYVTVEGSSCSGGGDADGRHNVATDLGFSKSEMGAGHTVTVDSSLCSSGNLDLSDATVTVVWDNGLGDSGSYQTWES